MALPQNFNRIHDGEEFLRARSVETIEGSPDLLAHAHMVESTMDLVNYFAAQGHHSDDDNLIVRLLGIRMFNAMASSLKLLLAGYYQNSALIQRDLLESVFLLDYFRTDRSSIQAWRRSDKKLRVQRFGPAAIRKLLDDRDGFTKRKREAAYQLLSELAGHPTYASFRMLAPKPGSDAHCGPFFEATSLNAVLAELAKHAVQAGETIFAFVPSERPSDFEMKIAFLETKGGWMERFFGRKFDPVPIEELRSILRG